MKKIIWTIVIIIIVLIVGYFISLRFSPNFIPADTPIIGKFTCPYPMKIAGNSMAPTLTSGTRITFDRCVSDKSNIAVNTIVAYEDNGVVRITRIVERTFEGTNVIYKTAQDGKASTFVHVPATDIIATYQN